MFISRNVNSNFDSFIAEIRGRGLDYRQMDIGTFPTSLEQIENEEALSNHTPLPNKASTLLLPGLMLRRGITISIAIVYCNPSSPLAEAIEYKAALFFGVEAESNLPIYQQQ